MTLDQLAVILLVGLVAGFLATHVMSGRGFGLIGDLLVGIVGALFGTWLFGKLGVAAGSIVGQILIAFVGALILLAILRLVTGGSRGWGRRRVY